MLVAYVLLIAASLALCGLTFIRKKYQLSNGTSIVPSLIFVAIYDLIVIGVGIIYIGISNQFQCLSLTDSKVLLLAATLAITITITTIICTIGSLYGSISIIIMMATLGQLLLSAVYGLVFDSSRNTMSPWMIVGFSLSIIIVVLNFFNVKEDKTNDEEQSKNKKRSLIYKLLCIAVFLTNGVALIIYSLMTKYYPDYGYIDFIVLYSVFGIVLVLLVLIAIVLIKKKKKGESVNCKEIVFNKRNLLLTGAYALLFLGGEFASLYTTSIIPIVVQAPLSFALQLLIITLFDRIVFKAKLNWVNYLQMGLAVVCSVMFVI